MRKAIYVKVFIICTVLGITIGFGWYFFTRFSSQSRASQDVANISYDTTTLPQGEDEEADVQFQIETPQGVSAFNIVLEASEGLLFDSIGESIQTVPPEKADGFSKIITYTSEDNITGKVAYAVISESDEELAKIVSIPARIINTSGTSGEIRVVTTESEVTGPEGVTYALESDHSASSDSSSDSTRPAKSSNESPGSSEEVETGRDQENIGTENDTSRSEDRREQRDNNESAAPLADTDTDDGPVNLKLLVRFQGIDGSTDTARESIQTTVSVTHSSGERIARETVFTYTESGVWEGSTSLPEEIEDIPVSVLIKGAKHLQRRICDNEATEESEGNYTCTDSQLTLQVGENVLDTTGIIFFAGDVTSTSGDQDGLIDSSDLAFIRNNIGSEEPDIVMRGDLNMDGRIDTQDYGLITASLSLLPSNTDEDETDLRQ